MLIRRYFRIRSLQFLYAQHLSKMNFKKVEKNMLKNIEELDDLYVFLLYLILRIRDKAIKNINEISTKNKISSVHKIAYNSVIKILSNNKYLLKYKYSKNYEKKIWIKQDESILFFLIKEMKKSQVFKNSIQKFSSSFEEEKDFIIKYYKNNIIPNKKLIDYIEDRYVINGSENLYIAHIMVCKTLKYIKLSTPQNFKLYNVYKNNENKKFIIDLYRNTIFHKNEFNKLIEYISKNWTIKRIATIDLIILQMAICEFLYFPSIPPKATINEYIEITKIFCMEKSKIFINGILDKVFKLLCKQNKIFKDGKGLI
ncbi:transcription antitermination factor NusB [Blattabacterium sp. (Cryptocercus kyebangensis)]|uniref:transcription antitermination factor NusB n=1 Tax=Blattabacterium sp. (Cryptocercus kyebangensis) TaxID=298656 RepID=UPI000D7C91E2|nr:transcription antitermination factor NusB [Blattabacterium sp. (Cryptocercus kyebangensis)]AWU43642.1 transcription antitermination factor NusB [Blattabacterium sp. (Cryptocercus kyebangensis)]